MISKNRLQIDGTRGWLSGFVNMLCLENGKWWGTRKWLVQSGAWLVIMNGMLAMMLWGMISFAPDQAMTGEAALMSFIPYMGQFSAIGIAILTQGAIIDEKKSGTAEWILSNPVSRTAFILAKLVANNIGVMVTVILLQGLVGYAQISLYQGSYLQPAAYLSALRSLGLHSLFYVALVLMLGTFFKGRGPVLGISIAFTFVHGMLAELMAGFAPWLPQIIPEGLLSLATTQALGQPLPSIVPIIATTFWAVLFVSVAIWRFKREEF